MKSLKFTGFATMVSIILMIGVSCKYDEVLPVEPDPGIQVSFNDDLIPIFNSSCNLSGCHNGSGSDPDLRPANAYASLWDGGYIDTLVPADSELYLWMSGARGIPMPLEGVNAGYASQVLQWIEQGGLNN